MSKESQQHATIKKLRAERDEAVQLLAQERSSPLLGQLQALATSLTEELRTRDTHVAAVKTELDRLTLKVVELQERVAHMAEARAQLTNEFEALTDALRAEHQTRVDLLTQELAAVKAKLGVEDAVTLKRRLAAKAEELRRLTQDRDRYQAAASEADTERRDLRAQLAAIPRDLREHARRVGP